MNLANKLTLSRCIMAMVFVALMTTETVWSYLLSYAVFTAAAITDHYDGKIARERNLITNFGKLLDPVADKVLMLAAFLTMMKIPELRIPSWAIVVILAREFLVTGARALAAAEGEVIAASRSGKMKTVLQMVYVFVFLAMAVFFEAMKAWPDYAAALPGGPELYTYWIGHASLACIALVAAYTVWSGIEFARDNWRLFATGPAA